MQTSVAEAEDKAGAPELVVTDSRSEDTHHRLMLLRGDKPWTRTTIRLAKVQNSDRIDKAGVELQDRRIKLIQAADGVLKTVFAIGGSAAPRGSASADERDAGCQL